MAGYIVIFASEAEKQFRAIPLPWKARVEKRINQLSGNPLLGKKMENIFKNRYNMRIWPYLVFYNINKQKRCLNVLKIVHRATRQTL